MKARRKVVDLQTLLRLRRQWADAGNRVVFTNGCFDLLHVGHLRYLEKAKSLGDRLVVGINTDTSVRMIKGSTRPVVPEEARAELVAGIHCVDRVILFNGPDPRPLIEAITPEVLVKGADWHPDRIVGADWVRCHGGVVTTVPLEKGFSTSGLIQKILISQRVIEPGTE